MPFPCHFPDKSTGTEANASVGLLEWDGASYFSSWRTRPSLRSNRLFPCGAIDLLT